MSHAPWLPRDCRGLSDFVSSVSVHVLRLWDTLNAQGLLLPPVSPLAPLGGFPWFSQGEHLSYFHMWARDGETRCGRFIYEQGLVLLDWHRSQFGRFQMDEWRYRQLHHFVKSLPRTIRTDMTSSIVNGPLGYIMLLIRYRHHNLLPPGL